MDWREGIGVEPAKNKQGKTYGIRFTSEEQTFKASEIGREFGFRSLAKNYSSSPEEKHSQQVQQSHNQDASNTLKHKKKKTKKRYYGRQF
jgi:hypothetical protein